MHNSVLLCQSKYKDKVIVGRIKHSCSKNNKCDCEKDDDNSE